jgi:chemotaxis protein methyltransferase WspC
MNDLDYLENMIEMKMGLDAASIGHSAIENALAARQATTGKQSHLEYRQLLEAEPKEFDNLIEELVIPETWFFRDDYIFSHILDICRRNLANENNTRILSLPCSTGEEIYSVGIHLDFHGIPIQSVELLGTDISRVALKHARQARYRDNSFRSKNSAWLKSAYFTEDKGKHKLDSIIRGQVDFTQSNILDALSLGKLGKFDIILCRNLLIYFNKDTKDHALRNLASLLASGGVIFFGHAESASIGNTTLKRSTEFGACAYSLPSASSPEPRTRRVARNLATETVRKPERLPFQDIDDHKPDAVSQDTRPMEQARKLADSGLYEQALDICNHYLKTNEPDTDAYHVLGLIHAALNNNAIAIGHFKKAVYLDPDHIDSLVHLSLLYKVDGDMKMADKFQARAERARKKGAAT